MQAINTMRNSGFNWSPINLTGMAARLWHGMRCWNECRRSASYLRMLSDRDLHDIGLRRADILSAVCGETDVCLRGAREQ